MAKKKSKKKAEQTSMDLELLGVKPVKGSLYTKLNNKIKKLNRERGKLKNLEKNMDEVFAIYNKRIEPIVKKIQAEDEKILIGLDKFIDKKSVSQSYKLKAKGWMQEIIEKFFSAEYRTPKVQEIEKKLIEMSMDDLEESDEMRQLFDELAEELKEEKGVDIDIDYDDFKGLTFDEIIHKFRQRMFEFEEEQKKSEIHLEKKKKHSFNDGEFKAVYKQLAKLLHPDVENLNFNDKQKEQLMKDLSLAWENRDYLKLLEINQLVRPNESEVKIGKKELKEIERQINEELDKIEDDYSRLIHEGSAKGNVYLRFYCPNGDEMNDLFEEEVEALKEILKEKERINKSHFKSISATKHLIDIYEFNKESINDMDDLFESMYQDIFGDDYDDDEDDEFWDFTDLD